MAEGETKPLYGIVVIGALGYMGWGPLNHPDDRVERPHNLIDEIVSRMMKHVDYPCRVVATGGLAPLIAKDSRTIEEADEMLTLEGLRILYDRNRGP